MTYFKQVKKKLNTLGFNIVSKDLERPWGGFYVIDESQTHSFIDKFFELNYFKSFQKSSKLSPKILIINPKSKLSWQYHERRKEIWKIIKGECEITKSYTNHEEEKYLVNKGDQIIIEEKQRHRLTTFENYVVVAEIWIHTKELDPSDELDIIRLSDSYGRIS